MRMIIFMRKPQYEPYNNAKKQSFDEISKACTEVTSNGKKKVTSTHPVIHLFRPTSDSLREGVIDFFDRIVRSDESSDGYLLIPQDGDASKGLTEVSVVDDEGYLLIGDDMKTKDISEKELIDIMYQKIVRCSEYYMTLSLIHI